MLIAAFLSFSSRSKRSATRPKPREAWAPPSGIKTRSNSGRAWGLTSGKAGPQNEPQSHRSHHNASHRKERLRMRSRGHELRYGRPALTPLSIEIPSAWGDNKYSAGTQKAFKKTLANVGGYAIMSKGKETLSTRKRMRRSWQLVVMHSFNIRKNNIRCSASPVCPLPMQTLHIARARWNGR